MRRIPIVSVALMLALGAASGRAFAHKMLAASRVHEDGSVLLQAFFPDGTPARGVRVEVRRPDGTLFVEGKSDREGKFVLKPPGPAGRWTACFVGSMGHRADVTFTLAGPAGQAPAAGPAAGAAAGTLPPPPAARPATPSGSENLIYKEPIPWFRVFAGLGFICGVSALLMCMRLRAELRKLAQR